MNDCKIKQEIMERSNGDVIPVINNVDIWLTVKDVAIICKASERTIRDHCLKGKYQVKESVKFEGSPEKTYLILFSSLPQDTVQQYSFYGQLSKV